jgi:hypothetical protein
MKNLLLLATLLLTACHAFAGAISVPVIDAIGQPVTNCQVVLQLNTDGATSGTNAVVRRGITNLTSSAGLTVFSNVPAASYYLTIYATPRGSVFSINVDTNNTLTNFVAISTGTNVTWTTWAAALTATTNGLQAGITTSSNSIHTSIALATNTVTTNLTAAIAVALGYDAATNTVTTNLHAEILAATNGITTNLVWRSTNTLTTNFTAALNARTNFNHSAITNLSVISSLVSLPESNTFRGTIYASNVILSTLRYDDCPFVFSWTNGGATEPVISLLSNASPIVALGLADNGIMNGVAQISHRVCGSNTIGYIELHCHLLAMGNPAPSANRTQVRCQWVMAPLNGTITAVQSNQVEVALGTNTHHILEFGHAYFTNGFYPGISGQIWASFTRISGSGGSNYPGRINLNADVHFPIDRFGSAGDAAP